MKLCNEDCHAVCDFCKYIDRPKEVGEGEGLCHLKNKIVDYSYYCDEFVCMNYEGE